MFLPKKATVKIDTNSFYFYFFIFKPIFYVSQTHFYYLSFLSLSLSSAYAQPPNDDLANAIMVNSLPFTHDVSDVESDAASIETNEIVCNPFSGNFTESWWYTFTVATAGDFTISAICAACTGFSGDVTLGIYTGTTHPLTEVHCQDNDNENSNGEYTTQTLAVGTYFVSIAGRSLTPDNPPITTTISSAGGVLSDSSGSDTASIPTLSEWGLIVLALLLMTLGTLYLVQPSFRSGFEQER